MNAILRGGAVLCALIFVSSLRFLDSATTLQKCLDVGVANENFQNSLYDFLSDTELRSSLTSYKNKTFLEGKEELECEYCYLYVKEKTGLMLLLNLFESKNHNINDMFWDSIMEVLPSTWHVYGTRPMKMSIISSRFLESCAANIFSLYKDNILEKYHTIMSSLKDIRILTMGKVMEICRTVRERMVSMGFDIEDGLNYFGKFELTPYYRCSSISKDNFADILLIILGRYRGYITKSKACLIVDSLESIHDLGDINDSSCYDVLKRHLFGKVIPTGRNQKNEAYLLCRELQLLRKMTYTHHDDFSSVVSSNNFSSNMGKECSTSSDVDIVDLTLNYLTNTLENIKITPTGVKMLDGIKIDKKRFTESCTNNMETLFAMGGVVFENKKESGAEDGKGVDKKATESRFIIGEELRYENSLVDLRNKLLLICGSLHMHILNSKIPRFQSTKVISPRVHNRSDMYAVANSNFLVFDRCENDQNITGEDYTITQDTISEIILTIIFNSSEDSLSSIALHNGFTKASICELSGLLVKSFNQDSTSQEPGNFIPICRSILLEHVLELRGSNVFEKKKLRKSIIKICSILTSTIKEMLIRGTQREPLFSSSYIDMEPLSNIEIGDVLNSSIK